MIIGFSNIVWDTDGEDTEGLDLPETTTLKSDSFEDETDVENQGADLLSDTYGFCVISFTFEIIS